MARPSRAPLPTARLACAALAFAAITSGAVSSSEARADVSSWMSAGSGYGLQHGEARGAYDRAPVLTFSVGVGSNPLSSIVVGGLVRTTTYFSLGTDLDLSLRVATGGFARGQWGLAIDVGPGLRAWEEATNYGHWPLHAMVLGGAPFGLQAGIGADFLSLDGGPAARGAIALIEVDFLRLTVMRQGATDKWWENPSPAGGRAPRDTEQR